MTDEFNPNGRVRLDAAALAMQRVRRFTRFRIQPAVYREARPVEVTAWTVGGEPVPFAEALTQTFEQVALGTAWGRPWDTVWFDVRGEVPAEWVPGRNLPLPRRRPNGLGSRACGPDVWPDALLRPESRSLHLRLAALDGAADATDVTSE